MHAVEQLVQARADALDAAAAGTDISALIDALLAVASLGDASATPQLLDAAPDVATLRIQAQQAVTRLRQRLAQTPSGGAPGETEATLTSGRQRLGALCGITLPGLVAVAIPADGHLAADLAQTASRLADATPSLVRQWLRDHARVRPAVEALIAAYDIVEAVVSDGARLDVRASQRPDGPAAPPTWVASQALPPPGGLNLVVQRGFSDPLPTEILGLFIDGWTETILAAQHALALAVHFDAPDSTPPQAILVAVAPDPSPDRQPLTWDLDTLTSTLALAEDRAVAAERHATAGVTLTTGP